jgi:ribosome-interacting GTPase 1
VYNKIDQLSIEEVDKLARRPHSVVISAGLQLNLMDGLLPAIWEYLDLVRVYTKRRGRTPSVPHTAHISKLFIFYLFYLLIIFLLFFYSVPPDFSEPIVMRTGATVEDVCRLIHKYVPLLCVLCVVCVVSYVRVVCVVRVVRVSCVVRCIARSAN